jgi:hypothetical protein
MNDLLGEALANAARGWAVIPLNTIRNGHCTCGGSRCKPGKHPVARLAPNGLKNATCDPTVISTWWSQWPDANVAIVTGAVSGLIVLDVDPAHGGDEALNDLEMIYGHLPQTVEVVTGSGGRHVYFRHPGSTVPNSAGKVGAGLDVRGDGGYVVAPPSLHISGRRYEWEVSGDPADVELAPVPDWLLRLMADAPARTVQQGAPASRSGLPLAKQALDFVANGAPVGQQRDAAVRTARSYLGAGYSVQDTAAALWRGLQASPCGDPSRPWTERDALDIADSIAKSPAPPPSPLNKPAAASNSMPVIYASCPNLATVTADCWAAIQLANSPPRYFRYGGIPSRIESDDRGAPIVRDLTPDRLRHELARVANWKTKRRVNGNWVEAASKPPLDVVKDLLATPDPPFPVLSRIVEVPVFAPDGSLQTAPGYHPAGQTYYSPAPGLAIPDVPPSPSAAEVARAKALIEETICDFPFVEEADRAHAVALMVLPFVRDMIAGATPNHLIEAPAPGSGKGLLADAVLMPSVGQHVGVISVSRDDDEMRKRLTSELRKGPSAILLDNINVQLDSAALAVALTALTWDDRVLGKSEMVSLSVRCAWVTTANNPTMSTEIARRCVRIRLDPKVDRPWRRQSDQFKHAELRQWVREQRNQLVWSILVLVQSWIAAGRPAASARPLGSYEGWARVIGGILEHCGIVGFLANLDEFYEIADLEGAMWRQFVEQWWQQFGDKEVGVGDLFPLAVDMDSFELGKGAERAQKVSFAKRLSKQRDRVIGEYRITTSRVVHKAQLWRLLRITPQANATKPPIPPLFNVNSTWQEVPQGVMLPNGCEIRMDQATGKTWARLPVDEEPEVYYEDDSPEVE